MLTEFRLAYRASKRLGAYILTEKSGMFGEQARAYSDAKYPPTPEDLKFEARLANGETVFSILPWRSTLSLLIPIIAMIYINQFSPPLIVTIAYGIANLGYVILAAGVFVGTYRVFSLTKRWHVFLAGGVAWLIGTILANLA